MTARPLRVCLIGPGRVGSEVLKRVRSAGALWDLRSVVVRALPFRRPAEDLRWTVDGEGAVAAPDVDVVIDANSDPEVGLRLLSTALSVGKAAVTANKHLAVHFGPQLHDLAASTGGSFGFDAAVCAALPVTTVLRQHCATDRVTEIDGLFSGTCNFVLSEMAARGRSLADAVTEAQRLGYAEPDATADLNALDAARKTALTAALASGQHMPLSAVARIGIEDITAEDHARAAAANQVIRLVSRIRLAEETPVAWVAPITLENRHPFALMTGTDNIVRIRAERLGTITISGSGAGAIPTAEALLADARHHSRAGREARTGPP